MKKRIQIVPVILFAALIVFAIGCSEDSVPTVSHPVIVTTDNFQHPPLEDAIAAIERYGYRAVNLRSQTALDNCEPAWAQTLANPSQSGQLACDDVVRLTWGRNILPASMTLRIIVPSTCIAAADFYPHPVQFRGLVSITWYIRELDLDDDFDLGTLVPLYVHDDGTVEEMPFAWRNGFDELVLTTNHFSRYILGSDEN